MEPNMDLDHRKRVSNMVETKADYWQRVYGESNVQGQVYLEREQAVIELVERFAPGGRVIEIGCGAGRVAAQLGRLGHEVDAYDVSPAMVAQTRLLIDELGAADHARAELGDLFSLPADLAPADVVVGVGLLPWVDDLERALSTLASLVRRGGYVVVTADNRLRLTTFTDPLANPLLTPLKLVRRRLKPPPQDARVRQDIPRRLDARLRLAGLEPVERRMIGFGPFTFWRRQLLADRPSGVRLHRRLQRLADRRVPIIRGAGWHYLVVGHRADGAPRSF
jgi:SAM-dependent methyltransferase